MTRYFLLILLLPLIGNADEVTQLHESALVIDTHSDFLDRSAIDGSSLDEDPEHAQTTLARLKQGRVDAQFFSVFVPPAFEHYGFARRTFELIDRLYLEIKANRDEIQIATSTRQIRELSDQGIIAALIGIEGGHSIEGSLALLRIYYRLGVRYMTLTWNNTNQWADSSNDEVRWNGLNAKGEAVVREMNQLGMMIDISHVSDETFWDVMAITTAPVIASHSLARGVTATPRNMSDDMIRAIADNDGVIQVSFYAKYLDQEFADAFDMAMDRAAHQFKVLEERYADDPIKQDKLLWSLEKQIERSIEPPDMQRVIDHIDHIVAIAGVDHAGIGSDFDGLGAPPAGLEHVGKLDAITRELLRREYTADDIKKILGGNLIRVMGAVEKAAKESS